MLNRAHAVLVVVDFQDKLMPKDPEVVTAFLDNAVKLIQTAKTLDIPILVTEQYPEKLGGSTARIDEALGGTPRLPKLEFSCFANDGFREALAATGRRQCIVMGMETHICVLQTTLGLKDGGFEPYVVRDAVVSAKKAEYKAGLARLVQEGVPLVTAQMTIFELLRAAGTPEFKKMLPLLK
ncbi:isochorismatase family protein [Roseovarius pacificus]|uniref:isochorismatase family protein n=1 Tax=Roseovarius pacificus TaxID=337701 RepID=UPI002A18B438|nr:isochorismatase family protein [Roseovarius pacificus]